MLIQEKSKSRWIGKSTPRVEDSRLIQGKGRFLNNIKFPGALHAVFLRSNLAHATLQSIDVSEALRHPGVRLVLTGKDVKESLRPWPHLLPVPDYYGMAVDKVRYAGEPLALIVASDPSSAEDALDLIRVNSDPLPVVSDIEGATKDGAPLVHAGFKGNVAWHKTYTYGDVDAAFRESDLTVSERFYFPRYASTPLDTTTCVAEFDRSTGELTIWDHNQQAPMYHARYAKVLGISTNKLRIINPEIGGGFGNKVHVYSYSALIALAAIKLGATVRWVAERREDMEGVMHSPDRVTYAQLALKRDGTMLGLKLNLTDNFGAFLRHPEPHNVTRAFPTILGPYRVKAISIDAVGVFTNTCPTGPDRGYGQQHSSFVLERMVDIAAKKLSMSVDEIRFKNLIPADAMPYETPLGSIYDSGDYPTALAKAMELVDYKSVCRQRDELRKVGRYLGVGLGCIVEGGATGSGFVRLWGLESKHAAGYASASEAASIRVLPDGRALVAMGTVPQGQGHETAAAQIVADRLGLDVKDVKVATGFDSQFHPYSANGSGTYASRFSTIGVGALLEASEKIRAKMLRIASYRLKVDQAQLEFEPGRVVVKGDSQKGISIKEIARISHSMIALLPPGLEPGLDAVATYTFPNSGPVGDDMKGNLCTSYANLAGAAVVEVDSGTGVVKIQKLAIVHDAGTIINPLIVKGQIDGGAAHGVGGALYEQFVYNEDGQLLSNTFADYLAVTAVEMPRLTTESMESPSPFTPLGAKGCGEGSSILLPSVLSNAVEDALSSFGVAIRQLPLSPEYLWRMIGHRAPS